MAERPPPTRKRSVDEISDLSDSGSGPSSAKRQRGTQRAEQPTANPASEKSKSPKANKGSKAAPINIDTLDLTQDDNSALKAVQPKQTAEHAKAPHEENDGTNAFVKSTCNICMDTEKTDLAATHCGHSFCRACLVRGLQFSIKNQGNQPNRHHQVKAAQCPTCRTPVVPNKSSHVIPLLIKKKATGTK